MIIVYQSNFTYSVIFRASYLVTGSQSMKAFKEAQNFLQPKIANDYSKMTQGKKYISQQDISYDPKDAFLFYVDEEPQEGVAVNFTPKGKFNRK